MTPRLDRVREPAGLHIVGHPDDHRHERRATRTWSSSQAHRSPAQNPRQFTLSDTCHAASPLSPGDQCTMTVQFFPTTVGSASAVVQVNANAPAQPADRQPLRQRQRPRRSSSHRPRSYSSGRTTRARSRRPRLLTLTNQAPTAPSPSRRCALGRPEPEQLPDHRRKLRRSDARRPTQLQRDRAASPRTRSGSRLPPSP